MQHVEPLPFPALIPPREVLGMGTQSYPPRLVERRAMGMEMPELTLPDLGPLAGGSEFGLAGKRALLKTSKSSKTSRPRRTSVRLLQSKLTFMKRSWTQFLGGLKQVHV